MMQLLLRRVRFGHVGRRHTEQLSYTPEACREFNLLLARPEDTPEEGRRKLGSRAVNRLFVSCLFSRIIGNNFPLSIYISQTVNFHRDVQIDEQLTGDIEVLRDLGRRKYEIRTLCLDAAGAVVVDGTAIILQE